MYCDYTYIYYCIITCTVITCTCTIITCTVITCTMTTCTCSIITCTVITCTCTKLHLHVITIVLDDKTSNEEVEEESLAKRSCSLSNHAPKPTSRVCTIICYVIKINIILRFP